MTTYDEHGYISWLHIMNMDAPMATYDEHGCANGCICQTWLHIMATYDEHGCAPNPLAYGCAHGCISWLHMSNMATYHGYIWLPQPPSSLLRMATYGCAHGKRMGAYDWGMGWLPQPLTYGGCHDSDHGYIWMRSWEADGCIWLHMDAYDEKMVTCDETMFKWLHSWLHMATYVHMVKNW